MNTDLLLIDFQNDFCSPDGSLYVMGAKDDCIRISDFICRNLNKIDNIYVTMDTHSLYHIAHPLFWKTPEGNHPDFYTQITYKDFFEKKFLPCDSSITDRVDEYLQNLEEKNRYTLTIWPPHCLFGSIGAALESNVFSALHEWEKAKIGRRVNFITKAMNPYTEHYSAIQAEIPDPNDPETHTNKKLIDKIKDNKIIVAGEALSHCVANTIRDLSQYIPTSPITLVTDCCSNVAGFEYMGEGFYNCFTSKGMRSATSKELIL